MFPLPAIAPILRPPGTLLRKRQRVKNRPFSGHARESNFHPTQRLTEQPDGSLLVELEAGGLLEMCWHLVTWGSEVEILRPKRLQRLMAELRQG